jgi:FkbM family methyltransferase
MKESELLAIKFALGRLHLLHVSETVFRVLSPSGKRFHAHRQKMIAFYSQFVRPGDLCFDVGANLGSRIDVFLACGARVIAIEPQENCMHYLRLKYGRNPKVTLIRQGLGDAERAVEMHVSSEDSATSSMVDDRIYRITSARHLSRERWDRTAVVDLTTIDRLIEYYGCPAFCKIDVEGFEYPVLKGLSTPIKALSFEYTPAYLESATNCVRRLAVLGTFKFNYSPGEDMAFALPTWVDAEEILHVLSKYTPQQPSGDVYARLSSDS